ncbi:tetratricopeptide repeat protein (macronuclear) [Tetrahymena thermophila SB210]|uniref:Tetratricopeptide repeat protein n=1 Tax=Tetrahymena thermophila (strain SB210) TaxID=312017 RepID=Q23BT7_TETTS|nr:tetratricopeptide repeat protein [Tetrahymena thermophila SB210]EAR94031.1 tetratricopeptide repeat protein [Tetrahymena thermophila SB210]|eukprot:XP_001014276.1 tetratricopeptide repeat protein [Tetrahymena thermophila SB210]
MKKNNEDQLKSFFEFGKFMTQNKDQFSSIAQNMLSTKQLLQIKQKATIQQEIEEQRNYISSHSHNIKQTVADQISLANKCSLGLEKLKKIYLEDLVVNKPMENCVVYVKTFCKPSKMNAINLGIEDEKSNYIHISLYNSEKSNCDLKYLDQKYPLNLNLAIKNPYMKMNAVGHVFLRNDNPENILFLNSNQQQDNDKQLKEFNSLKQKGNELFSQKQYKQAIEFYLKAIQFASSNEEKIIATSNISQALICQNNYQKAIFYADRALELDQTHQKSLFRKATSLVGLYDFEKALKVFEQLKPNQECEKHMEECKYKLNKQKNGFTQDEIAEIIQKKQGQKLVNFVGNIEIRRTQKMGRGVFATKSIRKNEVIAVCEFVQAKINKGELLVEYIDTENLAVNLNSQYFIREQLIMEMQENFYLRKVLSYLYRGEINKDYQIPNLKEVFVKKYYQEGLDDKIELTAEDVSNIVNYNTFGSRNSTQLIMLASFFNHKNVSDVLLIDVEDKVVIVSQREIQKDEEIFITYINQSDKDKEQVAKDLQKWGITEVN